MSHEVETLMLAGGQGAWHGLGTVIEPDVVTTGEALAVAKLDWTAYFQEVPEDQRVYPGERLIKRSSDQMNLGRVRGVYKIIQPADVLGIVDDLIGNQEARWHTAGSLQRGQIVFGLAKLSKEVMLHGEKDETIAGYLLSVSSFDGKMAFTIKNVKERVVCQNTLNFALAETGRAVYRVRHTEGEEYRREEARKAITLAGKSLDELQRLGEAWMQRPFGTKRFENVLGSLIPIPTLKADDSNKRTVANAEHEQEVCMDLWQNAPDLANVRNTAWAALNVFTAFETHKQRKSSSKDSSWVEYRWKRLTGVGGENKKSLSDDAKVAIERELVAIG